MSFSFNFTAGSVASARAKLANEYAPASVKALVELALAGIREPAPVAMVRTTEAAKASAAGCAQSGQTVSALPPRFIGVMVEAWGHIDEHGGTSMIQKFEVRPLFD
jgi:hypothetical protein